MPKRYIDADYVLKAIGAENSCGQCKQSGFDCFCHWLSRQDICGIINDAPTADVQPVKHGKWVEKHHAYSDEESPIEEWQTCKCSECGRYDTRPYLYYFSEPRFCSWCGADMRGETDG